MLFNEALVRLQDGLAMRRNFWAQSEGYLMLMPGMKHVWKVMMEPNPNAGNFIFSVADFLADDWEEFVDCDAGVDVPAE